MITPRSDINIKPGKKQDLLSVKMDQFAKSDGCETAEWQRVGHGAAELCSSTNHLTDDKFTSTII